MTCPGCGAWIPEESGFCRGCGTIVRGPRIAQLGPTVPAVGRAVPRTAPPPPLGYAAPDRPLGYGIVPPLHPTGGGLTEAPPVGYGIAPPPPPPSSGSASADLPPPSPAAVTSPAWAAPSASQAAPYVPPPMAPWQRSAGIALARGSGYAPAGAVGLRDRADTVWARTSRARGLAIHHSGADFLVAAFTAVSLVSLFLPFYEIRFADSLGDSMNYASTSALGGWAGGWRVAVLAPGVAILLYLAARMLMARRWPPGVPHFQLLLLLALANLALVVIAFFTLPAGGFSISAGGLTFGVTQAWGGYVGMSAAVLATAAAIANRPTVGR